MKKPASKSAQNFFNYLHSHNIGDNGNDPKLIPPFRDPTKKVFSCNLSGKRTLYVNVPQGSNTYTWNVLNSK